MRKKEVPVSRNSPVFAWMKWENHKSLSRESRRLYSNLGHPEWKPDLMRPVKFLRVGWSTRKSGEV